MLAILVFYVSRALLSELKGHRSDLQNIPLALLHDLDEYLVRCGINSPFEKVYIKHAQEFINTDMGRILAIVLISQLPKLQISYCTGNIL